MTNSPTPAPELSAAVLEAAAQGLRPFIDLARQQLKTEQPTAYATACDAIAQGVAVETIVVSLKPGSLVLTLCLLNPASALPTPLFSLVGNELAAGEAFH